MKEQLERLKAVIYQIIVENVILLHAIDFIKLRDRVFPPIMFSCIGGSEYDPHTKNIIISVKDIVKYFELAKSYNLDIETVFRINPLYKDYSVCRKECPEILLEMPMTEDESNLVKGLLSDSQFLQNDDVALNDAIAIYALAYTLYHEIGHIMLNNYIPISETIIREDSADKFAFESVRSMRGYEEEEILLLGVFIGIIHVLEILNPQDESNDKEHPHSIERLYTLFDFWGIEDDSQFWEFGYNAVIKWCVKHNQPKKWDKGSSISFKDRFISAYYFFKKTQ